VTILESEELLSDDKGIVVGKWDDGRGFIGRKLATLGSVFDSMGSVNMYRCLKLA